MIEVWGDLWAFHRPYRGAQAEAVADHGCDAVVITTNGQTRRDGGAVMGRGVARQAMERWPELQAIFGFMLVTRGNHCHVVRANNPSIVTFPVKHRWSQPADLNLIIKSARQVVDIANILRWRRVAIPRPGCGNGQLKWDDVRPAIGAILDNRFLVIYEDGHE